MEKTESKIQQEAIMHIWNTMPETRLCLFHVPNGMFTNAREGAKFKAQGVIAGVPDLVFVWAGKTHYIEVKTEKGRLSEQQKALHQKWAEQGVVVNVCRTSEEIIAIVSELVQRSRSAGSCIPASSQCPWERKVCLNSALSQRQKL